MESDLQKHVFETILSKFSKKSEAVESLSELLTVGKDAVYRRLRGDSLLTPNELSLLAKEYNISLDAYITGQTDTVFFTYNPFAFKLNNFEDYLNSFGNDLEAIYTLPETKIHYASSEIPIFLYCFFPELISFKLYIWGRTSWDFEYLNETPFDFKIVPYHVIKKTEQFTHFYNNIPSVELWSINIVNNTLGQIEYCAASGGFADLNDALLLCDKMTELLTHSKLMASKGLKLMLNSESHEGAATFDLFYNEIVYTNNTILVDTIAGKAIYTSFGNPNFLKSTDQRICEFTEEWFRKIMTKSQVISVTGEKSRDWFFNLLNRRVQIVKNKISLLIEGEI